MLFYPKLRFVNFSLCLFFFFNFLLAKGEALRLNKFANNISSSNENTKL